MSIFSGQVGSVTAFDWLILGAVLLLAGVGYLALMHDWSPAPCPIIMPEDLGR